MSWKENLVHCLKLEYSAEFMIQHQDLIHIHVIYTKLNICGLWNRFAASIYIFGQGLGRDICPVQTHVDRKLCRRKNKVNRDSQVKTSSCSAWPRRRPAMNTAQLTSRSRLRTEQPRSISSSTSKVLFTSSRYVLFVLICLDSNPEFSCYQVSNRQNVSQIRLPKWWKRSSRFQNTQGDDKHSTPRKEI